MTSNRLGAAVVALVALTGGSSAYAIAPLFTMPVDYMFSVGERDCVLHVMPLHPTTLKQPEGREVTATLDLPLADGSVRHYSGTLLGRGSELRGRLQPRLNPGASINTTLLGRDTSSRSGPLRVRVLETHSEIRVQLGSKTYKATRSRNPGDRGWNLLTAEKKRHVLRGIASLHPYPADDYPLLVPPEVPQFVKNAQGKADAYAWQRDIRPPHGIPRGSYGATAMALYSAVHGHSYSGLFESSGCFAMVRLSVDGDSSGRRTTARIELKLLVDGSSSRNLFGSVSYATREGEGNVFSHTLRSNGRHDEPCMREAAEVTLKGAEVTAPWAPRRLVFEPVHAPLPRDDFRKQLIHVKEGASIYRVYDGKRTLIGQIVVLSPFVVGDGQDRLLNFALPRESQ